jgi:type II secretory ATPase GspE/PulE/Tfp pilus assembly ATPase PilB-like protein
MTPQLEPSRLVDGIRSLIDRFKDQLAGPRQATRTQLVRYLALRLDIPEPAAARLFGDLESAGVIVRQTAGLNPVGGFNGDEQHWTIATDHADGRVRQFEPPIPEATDEPELMALELLRAAARRRATDIHIDPFGDEIEIRLRIDGKLEHYRRIEAGIGRHLMAQFKVLANLEPVEPFHAHEGRLRLPVDLHEHDVRITTVPVAGGEAVALRLLSRDQIIRPFTELGLSEAGVRSLREMMGCGEGLILVAGPSGAGKTTTLYSLLHDLDDGRRNIVTIEDPVEYLVPQFLQVEIDTRHGRTPASGLKTVLRMDADVILLAEIRDAETASAALTAASCGKQVLSTVHARDAAAAVTALRQLDIDERSLSSNVRGVIAQRLVRRVCSKCRASRPLTDDERGRFAACGLAAPDSVTTATGCDDCRGTGYAGRVGVFEIAPFDAETAEGIAAGKTERDLRDLLRRRGIGGLRADALAKVAEGSTTLEEIAGTCRDD